MVNGTLVHGWDGAYFAPNSHACRIWFGEEPLARTPEAEGHY